MSEIPKDVNELAYQYVEAAKAQCREQNLFLGTGNALDVLDRIIAKAILAAEQRGAEREREACAKIADEHAEQNDAQAKKLMVKANRMRRMGDPFGHGEMAAEGCAEVTAAQHEAQAIAAAIRSRGEG